MSIKDLADQLAAKGRYGDTELVHMTKGEVAGLQRLAQAAGGSLTINPDTGKPEAFFLAALLPTIMGAAAPALGAAATGAGLTGLGGLLSGKFGAMGLGALTGALVNRDDPLTGAFLGGIGGAGGGGLAEGLGLGGAGAAGATGQGLQNAALGGVGQGGAGLTAGAGEGLRLAGASTGAPGLTASASNIGTQLAAKGAPMTVTSSAAPMTATQILKSGAMAGAPLIAGAVMPSGGGSSGMPGEKEDTEDLMGRYEYRANPTGGIRAAGAPATSEARYFDPEFRRRPSFLAAQGGQVYAEGGGIAALARGGMKAGGFVVPADVVSMVGEGNTDAGYDRIKRMIPGATPIKGKDGGQADTVKTSIEGKQPARIAHGEMYVPPAAVKRAGGAKKLYAMMENVREQATDSKKQIKPVNLKKALA